MIRPPPRALALLLLALAVVTSPRLAAAPLRLYDAPTVVATIAEDPARARPRPAVPPAPPQEALDRAYGGDLAGLELAWHEDIARRHGFVPVLVGTLLALVFLVAGALAVRWFRRRRRAFSIPPRRLLHLHPESRARPSRPTPSPILAARGARQRGDSGMDPDVPKVEHDGRWHTLH